MQTAQAENRKTESLYNQSWAGTMTVGNVSQICEKLFNLLAGKEITIVTANEVLGYKPEVFPRQKLYIFGSRPSFEVTSDSYSAELQVAIGPGFKFPQITTEQVFSDGTFQNPLNPHFEFSQHHVTITWFARTTEKYLKNYLVLSV